MVLLSLLPPKDLFVNVEEKQIKKPVRIPIKNVEIHKPKGHGEGIYNPRDQIYVRKVKGVFQQLRQKMNFVWEGVKKMLNQNLSFC